MGITHLLEDFGPATFVQQTDFPELSEELIEEERAVSYEKGYSAGWDDAVTAKDKETAHISATLTSSLEDLNFTYKEAQAQLIESLDPMFKVLTSAVLPDTMAATFGHHIVDQMTDMAKMHTDQPMSIFVSPGEGTAVRSLLPDSFATPVQVQEDENLAPGQAYLRAGTSEREINSSGLVESIQDSIEAFTYHVREDSQYG
ncbi:ABC transporter ATP-binding protein [Pseudophaeobacter sp.]|jgi:flagellar assembly protein FliH|uniref:Flagellar assembly protein FliH n=1 Tax=Pseudophaeobacter arcticus TaxID=385492 RepID=A0ABQ0AGC2_9RHOB|nr:ABC transporter ATP-binding protein [Pseudophaeobacter sp.]UWS79649.1 ABC transporter ATP-binding protein [Phaeobacter sp. G2]